MPTAKILNYRIIRGQSILTYTTSTDLIKQLIEKSKRKVEDGEEGFMADFCVRYFKKTGKLMNDESHDVFVQDLIKFQFLEIRDN
jgi:hypothetical protein